MRRGTCLALVPSTWGSHRHVAGAPSISMVETQEFASVKDPPICFWPLSVPKQRASGDKSGTCLDLAFSTLPRRERTKSSGATEWRAVEIISCRNMSHLHPRRDEGQLPALAARRNSHASQATPPPRPQRASLLSLSLSLLPLSFLYLPPSYSLFPSLHPSLPPFLPSQHFK